MAAAIHASGPPWGTMLLTNLSGARVRVTLAARAEAIFHASRGTILVGFGARSGALATSLSPRL